MLRLRWETVRDSNGSEIARQDKARSSIRDHEPPEAPAGRGRVNSTRMVRKWSLRSNPSPLRLRPMRTALFKGTLRLAPRGKREEADRL